jgi:hypothetical protein
LQLHGDSHLSVIDDEREIVHAWGGYRQIEAFLTATWAGSVVAD